MNEFEEIIRNYILALGECLDIIEKNENKEKFFYTSISKANNLEEYFIDEDDDYVDIGGIYNNVDIDLFNYILVNDYFKYDYITNENFDMSFYELPTNKVLENIVLNGKSLLDIFYISLETSRLNDNSKKNLNNCNTPNWHQYNSLVDKHNKVEMINYSDYFRSILKNFDNSNNVLLWFDELYGQNPLVAKDFVMVLYNDFYKIMNYNDNLIKMNKDILDFNFSCADDLFYQVEANKDFLPNIIDLLLSVYEFSGEKFDYILKTNVPKWVIDDCIFNEIEAKVYKKLLKERN